MTTAEAIAQIREAWMSPRLTWAPEVRAKAALDFLEAEIERMPKELATLLEDRYNARGERDRAQVELERMRQNEARSQRVWPLTGAEILADLKNGLSRNLDGCVLLTAEDVSDVANWLDDDTPSVIRALLTPKEAS